MNELIFRTVLILLGCSWMSFTIAHPATERYIPIGYWASVSEDYSYIGEIKADDHAAHVMKVEGASGSKDVKVTEQTKIYLDRSSLKLINLQGTYADCQPGRKIEVKFKEGSDTEADWIKVEITTP